MNKVKILTFLLIISLITNIIFIFAGVYCYHDVKNFSADCKAHCLRKGHSKHAFKSDTITPEIQELRQKILLEQQSLIDFLKTAEDTKKDKKTLIQKVRNIHDLQFEIQKIVSLKILTEKKSFSKEYADNFFYNIERTICK